MNELVFIFLWIQSIQFTYTFQLYVMEDEIWEVTRIEADPVPPQDVALTTEIVAVGQSKFLLARVKIPEPTISTWATFNVQEGQRVKFAPVLIVTFLETVRLPLNWAKFNWEAEAKVIEFAEMEAATGLNWIPFAMEMSLTVFPFNSGEEATIPSDAE